MDILTELNGINTLPPNERETKVHQLKQQLIASCKDCTNKMETTQKVESILAIKVRTDSGFAYNDLNAKRYSGLALEIINAANEKYNITKFREKL